MRFHQVDIDQSNMEEENDICLCHEEYNHCIARNEYGYILEIESSTDVTRIDLPKAMNQTSKMKATLTTTEIPELKKALGFQVNSSHSSNLTDLHDFTST